MSFKRTQEKVVVELLHIDGYEIRWNPDEKRFDGRYSGDCEWIEDNLTDIFERIDGYDSETVVEFFDAIANLVRDTVNTF